MRKIQKYSLSSFALLLSLAALPTLSASSVFNIPLPSTCLNDVTQNTGTYNSGCTQRTNISVAQGTAGYYMGDIFNPTTSETISTLTMWVAVPVADLSGPTDVADAVTDDIGNLALYLGDIGSAQTGAIGIVSTDATITPWSYPTGTYPPVEYVATDSTQYDVFQVTFTLATPFVVTSGCGSDSDGCYAWAVTSDNSNFAPLISFSTQPFADISAPPDTYGAEAYFSGNPTDGLTGLYQLNENSIPDLGLAPSVDFTVNPEPATIGLLGIGLGLLGLKARRRS